MPKDVLEEVRRLIALTSSSNKNEARTAAFLACKLIREKELKVAYKDNRIGEIKPQRKTSRSPRRANKSTGFSWFDGLYDEMWQAGGQRIDVHIYTTSSPGICFECGESYSGGEKVASFGGMGTCHIRCSAQHTRRPKQ